MKFCKRYKEAFGFTIWKWNNTFIELWIFPPNFIIPLHRHPNIDGKITFLLGSIFWKKNNKSKWVSFRDLFTTTSVRNIDWHGGIAGSLGCIFLNRQRWLNKCSTPLSPSQNIIYKYPETKIYADA